MKHLWAPWRFSYVTDAAPKKTGCFFCNAYDAVGVEAEHLLLGRYKTAFVMMNRFPYNCGHLMVAPVRHTGCMDDLSEEEAADVWQLLVKTKKILSGEMNPDGFNVGINQGKCAGAGVLDHLHVHLVPRWDGDANFMPVVTDHRVLPQSLQDGFSVLRPIFQEQGL